MRILLFFFNFFFFDFLLTLTFTSTNCFWKLKRASQSTHFHLFRVLFKQHNWFSISKFGLFILHFFPLFFGCCWSLLLKKNLFLHKLFIPKKVLNLNLWLTNLHNLKSVLFFYYIYIFFKLSIFHPENSFSVKTNQQVLLTKYSINTHTNGLHILNAII